MKNLLYIIISLVLLIVFSIFLFQSFSHKERVSESPESPVYPEKPISSSNHDILHVNMSPTLSVELPEKVSFAGEEAPLDVFYVREYLDRELIVNTYFHSSTILLFKRANRWFPVIEPILEANNIPNDFKYLPLIESGFENVVSPAGAHGYWQFLKKTGREYGLEVNNGIDERYNVEKATKAACKYLNDAFEKYQNWTLVAASYNAGKRRISEELAEQKVESYYELLLNKETARYVFRMLAIKTIFENPEQYGFYLNSNDLYAPLAVKKIKVTKTVSNLVDFAFKYNTNYKTLKILNPWLRQERLPNRSGRTYYVSVPLEGDFSTPALDSGKQELSVASD